MSIASVNSISLSDNFPWGVAVLSWSQFRVVAANHYMESIYGLIDSVDVSDLFSLSQGRSLKSVIKSLEPGGRWSGRIYPRINQHGISSVEVVFERMVDDSDQVWLYTLEHPMVNDEVRFSSRSELKMLRVLLDNTLEYVFFRDLSGNFILANDAFRSAVAHNGRIPGMDSKIEDYVSEKSAAWMKALDMRMFETGKPVVNEVSLFVFLNGTKHWLQLTTVPVRSDEGVIVGSLSVARDISDLKRTESDLRAAIAEAHEASRAKGDFLAAMSHEIRTPINGIVGASELCRETPLDVEQRGYLDTVIQCGSTLLSLVNDVLDFSKIEAGQLNLESLNFSPRNLIESVAEEFSAAARSKKIELVVGYDAELPEYILGDPTRLKQIFYNLVGNAVKFTESGEIVIRADVVNLDSTAVRVLFSVADSGIGISKDRQEAIFHSFTQADMSTTRKYGGSGLGLSICKELVRMMDGRMSVVSEVGQGARFDFEIPFKLTGSAGADVVSFNVELAGLRVLIVDDNQTNCDLYQQMCAGWGYSSEVAKDGVSALVAMENAIRDGKPYRLILLDQQMPGLTGLDLASLVHSRPDLRETQIILLSSSLNRQESERAKEIGVARALAKPVKRATLQEVILETFGVGGASGKVLVSPSNTGSNRAAPLHVLLVEDNPINQDLACRRLKKLGHRVSLAENGLQAVEQVQKNLFDCILMDIQMPIMDGFEATRRIRSMEAESGCARQYIIAMTAHAMQGDRERCLDSGMDNYIPKPFRAEILKAILKEVVTVRERRERSASEIRVEDFALRLGALDPEDREDVIATAPTFLKSLPQDLLRLQNAVNRIDFKECSFVGHTLKGVAGIFRCEACLALVRQLEGACEAKDKAAMEKHAAALGDAMQALAKEVESLLI
jgi:PAS domain S-box-containing protein